MSKNKTRSRLWAAILSAAMIASMVTPVYAAPEADAGQVAEAVDLCEAQVLGETVPVINNSTEVSPLVSPYTGYFTGDVTVGETVRSYKLYIPANYRMKTYQIVMNVPDGITTEEFLQTSGWKQVADEEEIMLRLLEPGAEGWGAEDDLAYMTAALNSNNSISTFAYVVGYGVGGSVLQKYTMANAANYGACAFVDASEGIEAEYMADMANHHYMCNPSRQDSAESYAYDELPMPIWFVDSNGISEAEQAVIDYWKKPGDIQGEGAAFYDGQIYSQGAEYNYLTPITNVNKMAITADPANATPANIYEFLDDFIRYGGTSMGSNSLFTRPDYKELGVVEDFVIHNNIRRDYIVYVPESVDTTKEAPVIFTLHGSGSGHYMEFDASDWWEIADKEGLIVVSVNGTITASTVKTGSTPGIGWPGAGDGECFRAIIAQMEANGYKMDHQRLYIHGQSAGGRGVAGMIGADPTLFAAAGSTTNGCIYEIPEGLDATTLPGLFSLVGEYDNSNNFFSLEEGTQENPSNLAVVLRARGVEWEYGSNNGNVAEATEVEKVATYTIYRWKNEAGKTLYECGVVENRGHSMKADNCWRMWEEFSKYTRDEYGNLLENGEPIYEPVGPLGKVQELGQTVPIVNNSTKVSPLVSPYTGYFNGTVQVGDATRTYKLYIPRDFRMKTYQIVLNVPAGVDTEAFLVESGWKAVADEAQIMLRVLEPGEAGWSMDDLDYITAAVNANSGITTFGYIVGYGEGGSVLQKYTMANAANFGACAFVDATAGIDADYMASMATMNYKCNPSRSDSPDSYAYNELPMPIWFVESDGVSADEQAVIDYWKKPGDIQGEGVAFFDGKIFSQGEAYNYLTPISNVTKVAVTADPANATPANIYGFLKNFIRYGGTSLGSNSLFTRPDYKALGVVEDYVICDDIRRDYLVYVPESVDTSKEAPVVFTLHGSGSGHYMEFDASDWWEIADQNGLIVVSVNGTITASSVKTGSTPGIGWPGAGDGRVFRAIIAQMEENGYKMDHKRLYAHGQSLGGRGVAGMVVDDPTLFAAAGTTTNASIFDIPVGTDSSNYPGLFSLVGEYDNSNNQWSLEEGTRENPSLLTRILWSRGITWKFGSNGGNVKDADEVIKEATYTLYRWKNAAGKTLYEFAVVENRGHSMKADNCWKIWKEFSKYTRDDEGNLLENGERVFETVVGPLGEAQELGQTVPIVNNSPEVSPLVIPYTGYFNGTVKVGDATRTYKLYIPEGFRMKTYQIVLNVPDGVDTAEFLVESGWKAVADKEQIMLRVLEPGKAGWGMDDLAYIKAALGSNNSITTFAYVVGYGEGGSVLQKYTMADAANYGACVFVDASAGIDAEYMASMATMNYKCNPSRSDSPDSYAYDELPMPIWFVESDGISEEEQAVIDYWKKPGDIQGEGVAFYDGQIYSQGEAYNYLTPITNVNKMAITADPANATPENIYGFLKNFIRYGGTSLGSNSLFTRPDYKELGVVEDYVICDDIRRDYLVYVPESVDTSKEAPVVFTLHGSGSGHYMEFDASDWWEIADKNGLIVVSVNGTITATSVKTGSTPGIGWPGAGDGRVFRAIIAQMEENGYKMDHKRLYAHGQSLGGRGVAGMVVDDPTLFAAAGTTTNASIFDIPVGTDSSNYPGLFSLVGEYDNSNNQFSLEEGTEENPSLLTRILWSRGITWKFGTNNGNVKHPDEIIKEATYTVYRWKNAAGKTLYEFAVVENRGHSMKADNCWKVWEEFSKYTRDDEGNLLENGERVFVETKAEPQTQTVVMNTTAITKTYGDKAFTLKAKTTGDGKLTYKSSDTKVVKVDKNGKVTIKGTGKAVITITAAATENYKAATLKVTIKVVPKKAAIASAKVSKKNLTVKVKKDTKASGYQVQVSSSVNFAKKSTCLVTTAKNSKVTATVKNLKPGTYYVRTRAYKTVGSGKYYGAYSAVKVIVVK